jgi:hypothetical protein
MPRTNSGTYRTVGDAKDDVRCERRAIPRPIPLLTTAPYRFCDTAAERYDQQSAACCQWPRRAA